MTSSSRQAGCSHGSKPQAEFALGCCVQRSGEPWPWGEASVSWTLHSTALSPPPHTSSRMTVSVKKKIFSVFTTLVIFLFYISKENFFDTLKTIQGNFFKNADILF